MSMGLRGVPCWMSLERRTGPEMADQKTWRDDVDELELEDDIDVLVEVGRTRKSSKKKTPVRAMDEIAADDREDKRRKRRWEAPPHKRMYDYEPGA